jgi:3-oxoacyl-(acyl-carrier-protein) synthase
MRHAAPHRVVISGLGAVTSLGLDCESTWQGICRGATRVGYLRDLMGIPDGELFGAEVDLEPPHRGMLKVIPMCERAAEEALRDAGIRWNEIDSKRFGCSINAHMGDSFGTACTQGLVAEQPDRYPWWKQWLPNTACSHVARHFGLMGPRFAHSTACASSLISTLVGVRAVAEGQCDLMLAGGGDAIDPLFAAGFRQMRVLAEGDDPAAACRPFDRHRNGFVLGEGAGMLVLERYEHALERGARIYAEVLAGHVLGEAHHVTGLDSDSDALSRLIELTLDKAKLGPDEVGYINAHGTGTQQNDLAEMRAIRRVFGPSTPGLLVSGTKSMLGHMINAAGAVELVITALAMRDGFAPPTINVSDPDPECVFDCLPQVGKLDRFQHALKLSVAFGGHLAAIALRRWNDPATGFAYPDQTHFIRRAA